MRPFIFLLKTLLIVNLLITSVLPGVSSAQARPGATIIRDSEIETTLAEWIQPLLEVADLGAGSVNLIIVQSPQVNAFVAGGANMFIFTGLIEKTETPEELIGVMAHELGHIAGGHLVSIRDSFDRASYESMLGMVLGIGAAVATGNGALASAIVAGSTNVAQRRFLANSRVHESSADQAALRILEDAEMSPIGLKTFLEKLESEQHLPDTQQSEYMRTHPLTRTRIDTVENGVGASLFREKKLPIDWYEKHARMKAKLTAFINPSSIPWTYDDRDQSIPATYARAIAAYRENKTDEALRMMDTLLEQEPQNPYFLELKGQMLVDFSRIEEAIPYYRAALEKTPRAGLMRIALGHAYLETNRPGNLVPALEHLKIALRDEPRNARTYRLLATAYGRQGQENVAKLYLAEEAVLQRRLDYAERQAKAAQATFAKNSAEWLKAQDILTHIKILKSQNQ